MEKTQGAFVASHKFFPTSKQFETGLMVLGKLINLTMDGYTPASKEEEEFLMKLSLDAAFHVTHVVEEVKEMNPHKLWEIIVSLKKDLADAFKQIEEFVAKKPKEPKAPKA
jgi:hypothetical protein